MTALRPECLAPSASLCPPDAGVQGHRPQRITEQVQPSTATPKARVVPPSREATTTPTFARLQALP